MALYLTENKAIECCGYNTVLGTFNIVCTYLNTFVDSNSYLTVQSLTNHC